MSKFEFKSPHAESAVVGHCMTDKKNISVMLSIIEPEDFATDIYKNIAVVIKERFNNNLPCDMASIADCFKDNHEPIGGLATLANCLEYAYHNNSFEEHCREIKEKSSMRQVLSLPDLMSIDIDGVDSASDAIERMSKRLGNIAKGLNTCNFKSAKEVLYAPDLIGDIVERSAKGENALTTGFKALDELTGGFGPGNLITLGARPGMGKTALLSNIAFNVASQGKPVLYISLEMLAEDILSRGCCYVAEVDHKKLTKGQLNKEELIRLNKIAQEVSQWPFYVVDVAHLPIRELVAVIRRVHDLHGLSLVCLDYIQLVQSLTRCETREREVSEISRSLKALALEIQCPIVAAAQLSRKVEERPGHRPQLGDLRESGSIEQDSDKVLFLLRRDYYDMHDKPGLAEVLVAKNRQGALGNVTLEFAKEHLKFADYVPMHKQEWGV